PAFLEPMQTAVIGQSSGSGPLREVVAQAVLLARLAIGRDDVSEMLLRHGVPPRLKLRRSRGRDAGHRPSPQSTWLHARPDRRNRSRQRGADVRKARAPAAAAIPAQVARRRTLPPPAGG